jgi:hypothetical protein
MTDPTSPLEAEYAALRREAEIMAGANGDLRQRALVYHHLFRHSGGNHVFPLLAAHGALWARGYFALGMKVGLALSLLDFAKPEERRRKLTALAAFADAFRSINRRVCIEVYATYRFTSAHGEGQEIQRLIEPDLLESLNRCHSARKRGQRLEGAERRDLFEAFFRWEQRAVVAPSVEAAIEAFHWTRIRDLALRPNIRFAYIPRRNTLRFADFADVDERIEKGLRAYDIAEDVGWDAVEKALSTYRILPADFVEMTDTRIAEIRARVKHATLGAPPSRVPALVGAAR